MEFIKIQKDIQLQLKKAKINFKKSPNERVTKSYVENRIEIINNKWQEFSKNHSEILKSKECEGSSYFSQDIHTEVEEFFIDFKSELTDLLEEFKGRSGTISKSTSQESKASKTSVRLPKITIPTFSGRYTEWICFRDLFVSLIHNNEEIDRVQKLHYLKGHLTGEAEQLVRHIAITNDNYEQCWNLLEQRFNNKQFLANSIFSRFFSQRQITSESATGIKQLLDNTTGMLQGLQNLGINTSTWDAIVIYIVSQKLDTETRKQWEAKVSEITFKSNELPNFDHYKNFLENRFHSLEFLDTKTINSFNKDRQNVKSNFNNNVNNFYVSQISCSYCNGNHKISTCKDFIKLDIDTKRSFVQKNRLCFNCLANNHGVKFCRNATSCHICKRRHHSLLHSNSNSVQSDLSQEPITSHQKSEDVPTGSAFISKGIEQISLLPTAIVYVDSRNGIIPLRALIDQGSHISFITQAAVQLLGLKCKAVKGNFSGLGGEIKVISKFCTEVILHSSHNPDCNIQVTAYVLNKITGLLPPQKTLLESWSAIETIKLADPEFRSPNKIDILLGSDVYGNILREGFQKCPFGSLIAQETIFGWVLTGTNKRQSLSANVVSLHVQADEFLKSFWEMETEPQINQKIMSEEEQRCEEIYAPTTIRDDSGRYIVRLPFKEERSACLDKSREIALKRFIAVERKLENNKGLKDEFRKTFDEYLQLKHMRPINNNDKNIGTYLPYHAVIREDKTTTKVRVVFDASCKDKNGVSLNDRLMVGPTLQPELRHILLRWRIYPICLCADIIKMYRQIRVNEDDANYQRIFWRDSPEKDIKEYKLLRVTFGTSSAPYLAVKTLIQLAIDEGSKYPIVADRIRRDFYMDDFMSGCESVEEAIQVYEQLTNVLKEGGFEAQKWRTNDKTVMDIIQKNSMQNMEDEKGFEEKYESIITAKIFIQKLWLSGLGWDDELPRDLLNEWIAYRENLDQLNNFRLPRWMKCGKDDCVVELHGFSDASNAAYGAVIYLRVMDSEGNIDVSLLSAKTRVAPIKQVSVPRLELCGSALLAKLLVDVGIVLNIPKQNWHAWTDSEVVLAWLSGHPCKWKPFIANRVATIISLTDRSQWAYVQSRQNPADAASRGVKPSEIAAHALWAKGPEWLKYREISYVTPKNLNTNREERLIHVAVENEEDVWEKCSSLARLLRVVAYCKSFLRKSKTGKEISKKHTYLLKEEIQSALDTLITKYQGTYFGQEIQDMRDGKNIKTKSKLTSLYPYLDEFGILRVGGRIQLAQIEEYRKHPIIMPHDSHLTKLLVADSISFFSRSNYEQSTLGSLRRWQLCQRMVQHFWKRWSHEYLVGLMHRHKWNRVIPEPVVGDVVLVREPGLPPAKWLMGKVVERHPGADNITRVVTLRYKNSLIKRPVSKICVLPIRDKTV